MMAAANSSFTITASFKLADRAVQI